MSDRELSRTTAKLKIFALVADSYRVVFGNLGIMARILWLPIVLMGIVSFRFLDQSIQGFNTVLQAENDPATLQAQLDAASDPMFIIYTLVSWVVMCAVFVSLHRFVLLGERPLTLGFAVRKREWRYLGYLVVIVMAASVVTLVPMLGLKIMETIGAVLLGTTGGMVGILSFVALMALMVFNVTIYIRLGFVMPAIALDQEGGLRRRVQGAWSLAKGNTFRMFIALTVASLPYMLIFGIWSHYFKQSAIELMKVGAISEPNMMITMVIFGVVSYLSYAVTIAMYSIAYQTLELCGAEQQAET